MAGNEYGPRGINQEELDNRKLEETLVKCLNTNDNLKDYRNKISSYCTNHSYISNYSLPLSDPNRRIILPTRDIRISITSHIEPTHTLIYNTASKTYKINKWDKNFNDLSEDQINTIISCIEANTGIVGGRGRRKNKTRSKKRTKRRASRKN